MVTFSGPPRPAFGHESNDSVGAVTFSGTGAASGTDGSKTESTVNDPSLSITFYEARSSNVSTSLNYDVNFATDCAFQKSRPNDNSPIGGEDHDLPNTFSITQSPARGSSTSTTQRTVIIQPAVETVYNGNTVNFYSWDQTDAGTNNEYRARGDRIYFYENKWSAHTDSTKLNFQSFHYAFDIKELSSVVFLVNNTEITSDTTVKIGDDVGLRLTAKDNFKEPTTDGVDTTMSNTWCDSTTNMITFTVDGNTFVPTLSPTAGAETAAQEWTGEFRVSSSYSSGALSFKVNFLGTNGARADRITETTNGYGITLDTTRPYITTLSISNENSQFVVTFNESVYNSSSGSGSLQASNFSVSISDGTATYDTHTLDAISNSNKTYTLGLSLIGTSNGSQQLTVTPVSIYDAAGNVASSVSITQDLYDTTLVADFTVGTVSSVGGQDSDVWNNNSTSISVNVPIDNDSSLIDGTVQILYSTTSGGDFVSLGDPITITESDIDTVLTISISDSVFEVSDNYVMGNTLYFNANITDVAGNVTTGTESSSTITINTRSPTDFTVGDVYTSGTNTVDTYFNSTNTYIHIVVPIDDDTDLINGNVQIISKNTDGTFESLDSAITISSSDINTDLTISISSSTFKAFSQHANGNTMFFNAIITNNAGNSTTGTQSSVSLIIYTSLPTDFTVREVSSTGGTLVDNYYNTSNTSITVFVPIDDDSYLIGGNIQIISKNTNGSFESLGSTTTITSSDLDTNKIITISKLTFSSFSQYGNDETMFFNAIITDIAGNPTTGTMSNSTITIDTTAPSLNSVSIISDNDKDTSYAKAGNRVTLTMVASEEISEPTIVFKSGGNSISNSSITYENTNTDTYEWTASYVVSGSDTNGLVSFTINYTDLAGNSGTPVTEADSSVTIDVVDPTMEEINSVSIISNNSKNTSLATTGDKVTLTMVPNEQIYRPTVFLFSGGSQLNSVSYYDSADNEIDDQDITTLSDSWTASYTVNSDDEDGDVSFTIDYQDIAGNSGEQIKAVTNNSSVTVDTEPPTIEITATDPSGVVISSGSASNDEYLNLTFTASKELDGFDFQSVDILNDGELSNDSGGFDTSDNEIFTAQLIPGGTNTITVEVLAGEISDLFGNSNTEASNAFQWAYDGSNSTVIIYDTSNNNASIEDTSTNVSPVTFTIEIDELDTSFNVSDIDVSNGTLDNFQDASGDDVDHSYYTVDVYPSSEGSVSIRVEKGTFEDAVGNLNLASNIFEWTYDITPPTIEITATDVSNIDISSNETTNDEYLNLTFTASKEIDGFEFDNVIVENGELSSTIGDGDFDTSDNIIFTAELYPFGTQNSVVVYVDINSVIDTAGNYNDTSSNTFTWLYDGSNATVSIFDTTDNENSIEGKHSNTNPVTFTIGIDELNTLFTEDDIIVTNGTLKNFSQTDDIDGYSYYSVEFYPTEQSICSIRVLEGSFEDAAGNLNNPSNIFEWTYDTTVPIMTITATNDTADVEITSGDSFNEISILLKFTVDETTDDFDKDDIVVTNGEISDFDGADSDIYYAVFTANEEGECKIYVPANSFTDFDERSNPESNIFTWTYDITPPTISSVSGVTSTGSFKGGDRILLKVTFSEIVTLSSGDTLTLTLNNGESTTIDTIDATDTVKVYYTVGYTTNLDNLKVSSISLSDGTLTDAAGNIMIVFTGYTNLTDGYVIDNTKPVITSITPSWGTILTSIETLSDGTITVIIDSIEDGQNVIIQLNNTFYIGTTSSNTAIITIPAADLQILTEITHTIIVNVNDLAGNAAEEKSTSFLCDVTPPDTPTITFKETNTSFNYSYPSGSSVLYYKNNATGSTSKYYNNILSISFASDVYKWDYSLNGGTTYTTIIGTTTNTITLPNGTYNPGTIIIRNYDEATNVSSVTNTNQIIITYNLSGNTINNENMSTKLKIAQTIRLASK